MIGSTAGVRHSALGQATEARIWNAQLVDTIAPFCDTKAQILDTIPQAGHEFSH